MEKMVNRIREIILPTGGGAAGSLLSISAGNLIETVVYAAVGAVVGYLMKLAIDYIVLKHKICKRKRKQKQLRG